MSTDIRKLLVMNSVSSVIAIYIGIYVNLYLWEDGQRIADVAFYNMIMFIGWGAAFWTAAKLLTRFSIRLIYSCAAGLGGIAFAYLMTVTLDNRLLWIALLGLPVGMMFGFTSAAQNLGMSLQGKASEFSSYFAAVSIIGQALSVLVPIASAKVIDWSGYGGSFVLMLIALGVMLVFSLRMPPIAMPKLSDPKEQAELGRFRFRAAFGFPGAKWMLLSLLAGGVFLQFQNLFTLLFTFSVTQNKLWIALLNVTYTLVSLLGLWLYRRIQINESRWLWIGTLLLAAGFIVVMFPYKETMIASNLLTAIGMFYFNTVWTSQQFRCIQPLGAAQRASFLVWRETLLIVTRCLLLTITFTLTELRGALFIALIVITLICLLAMPVFQLRALRQNEPRAETAEVSA
ncbi:MFS transporter [Paenibacillus xanthanilyticus]|uniref:MFS transporter n=1 Tax=Paenibacillus xanthanilyticus TaxID=1783531 RepID=A0ABV8K9X8_9BACL